MPPSTPRSADLVRNVVLVGHSGAGKSTLVEALHRRLGSTSPPPSPSTLTWSVLEHAGVTVNLLDTPGSADFVGDLRAALRAADAAVFVVSAVDGIDGRTMQLWHELAEVGMPRAVVITQLDRGRADFDDSVAICQRVLGDGVHPLYLPMHGDDESVAGVIGLLSQRVYDWSSGNRVERDPDPEHLPLIENLRGDLIEAVISDSEDETLLDRYLDGEDLDPKVVIGDLETAVARGQFYPVLPMAPLSLLGTDELLEVLTQAMPTPLEHPCPVVTRPDRSPAAVLQCDEAGPLVAQVISRHDGTCLLRVFSGVLRPDVTAQIDGRPLKIHALGAGHPVAEARAGDLVAVRLDASVGDTISSEPLVVEPWAVPQPQHPVALESAVELGPHLARLAAEDRTIRVEVSEAGQQLLWTVGPAHASALLERLPDVTLPAVQVAMRGDTEPISTIEVTVPKHYLGTAMSDLSGRRARVTGSELVDEDLAVVSAEVPDLELLAYPAALRALSHGTGSFTRTYLRHDPR